MKETINGMNANYMTKTNGSGTKTDPFGPMNSLVKACPSIANDPWMLTDIRYFPNGSDENKAALEETLEAIRSVQNEYTPDMSMTKTF